MEPYKVKPGMQCTLSDGSLVEVQTVQPDNIHIRVKYLDSLDNPAIPAGTVQNVPFEELIAEYMGDHAEGLT
ncbi:MAG TPA: hypothetical protein VK821_05480 [Dehalococcoidia bacterium]|nr:hypothetical protein [Dehalococcoidia bacterium]